MDPLFCHSLQLPFPRPLNLLSDNKSAISITKANAISSHAKHIDIRYHFIRDHVTQGVFHMHWVPTEDMTADIFTKPLPLPLHNCHSLSLGLCPSPPSPIQDDSAVVSPLVIHT